MSQLSKTVSELAKDYSSKRKIEQFTLDEITKYLSLELKHCPSIVDVGCGSGRILCPLALSFPQARIIAVDISAEMIYQLKTEIARLDIKNITPFLADANDSRWPNLLPPGNFDALIFFQSIHFINLKPFMSRIEHRLNPGSKIVIATTTPDQFPFLPYCRIFPTALEIEISRTPSPQYLSNILSLFGFSLTKEKVFNVFKTFANPGEYRNWFKSKPFSVLSLISQQEFKTGVSASDSFYSQRFLIDKFSVFMFTSRLPLEL